MNSRRGWLFSYERGLELREEVLAPLQPEWVRCRVLRVQPSVTELMMIKGLFETVAENQVERYLGHEFVARVSDVGSGSFEHLLGQRVVCPPRSSCSACRACLSGRPWACESPFQVGLESSGAMCSIVDLPGRQLVPVPEGVSDLDACCAQPASSAVANLLHVGMKPGARVLILGQGTMGLLLLQAAKTLGAESVVTTAPRQEVRELSLRLGALSSLDPSLPGIDEELAGFHPDVVIDAAGGAKGVGLAGNETLRQALATVVPYGTVLEISDLDTPIVLEPHLRRKAVRIVFGQMGYYYGAYPLTLGYLRDRRMTCGPLVTHELEGLEQLPEALELMADRRRSGAIQVQLILSHPDQEQEP